MSQVSLSRTWPARLMPFASASAVATPTSASRSGSLYETAVKRWYSTKVSAIGPASSGRPSRKTLSHGTNTSSKTVSVSIILCVVEMRRDRDCEGDCPVLLVRREGPRGDDDELVDVWRARGVRLRAPDDDPVRPSV